jgi:hypothetical protein
MCPKRQYHARFFIRQLLEARLGDWHSSAMQLIEVASGVVDLLPLNLPENRGPSKQRISD